MATALEARISARAGRGSLIALLVLAVAVAGLGSVLSPAGAQSGRVSDGLVALYTFDDAPGTTIADTSGTGTPLDLTIADPAATTWTPDGLQVHSPTTLTHTGPATKITTAIAATGEYTLETWITPQTANQRFADIITIADTPGDISAVLWHDFDQYKTSTATTTAPGPGTTTATPPGAATTALTHLAVTHTPNGTHTIYLDGQPIHTTTHTGTLTNWDPTHRLSLANLPDNGIYWWLGTLHLTAIYQRALTPTEITQNHTAGPAPAAKLARVGG